MKRMKWMLITLATVPVLADDQASAHAGSFSGGVLLLCLLVYVGKRVLTLCERLPNEPR